MQPPTDLAPLLALHRGDGYASFHRKQGEEYINLFSLPAAQLSDRWPEVRPKLEHDGLVTINSLYRPGWRWSSHLANAHGAYRQEEGLRFLNAAFVDCDC